MAGQIVDGVVHFGQVVVDKITAKLGIFDQVQLRDQDTGEPVCVRVKSGSLVATPGACSDSAPASTSAGEETGATDTTPDTTPADNSGNSLQEEKGQYSTPAGDTAEPASTDPAAPTVTEYSQTATNPQNQQNSQPEPVQGSTQPDRPQVVPVDDDSSADNGATNPTAS